MITIEKLNTNNYSSRIRRAIARAFKEAEIIERYGSGIKRVKDKCSSHGIVEPKFEEFVHGFRVTLYKEFTTFVKEIKAKILSSQYEALKAVNKELQKEFVGMKVQLSRIP